MRKNIRMMTMFIFAACLAGSGVARAECQNIEGLRVDTPEAVEQAQNVCRATTGLGIFTEGISEITFPNLEYVHFLNIEASGLKAIAFPKLKKVDYLVISGGQLEISEFPSLQRVTDMRVQSRRLKFLNLPSLGVVGKLRITSNPSLQFIFVDNLYNVGELIMENNPALNQGTTAVIQGVTAVITPEERAYIAQQQEDIRAYQRMLIERRMNQPPPPPTGHPTFFDSFGTSGYHPGYYYRDYPDQYWNYWQAIGPYGYSRFLFVL
jgi:hypothetical protein